MRNDCCSNNNNNQKRETFLICKPFKVNVKYFYDNINHGNVVFVNNIVVSIDENVKSISKLQFDCVKYFDYGSNDNRSIVDAINVIFQRKNYKQCILNILKCSLCVDNNKTNNNVIIPSSQMYVIHYIIYLVLDGIIAGQLINRMDFGITIIIIIILMIMLFMSLDHKPKLMWNMILVIQYQMVIF